MYANGIYKRIDIKSDIIISVCFSFVLAFFGPLDFLYSNIDDLWMDVYNVFGGVIEVSVYVFGILLILLILADILLFKRECISCIVKTIVLYILVCLYIQGNYIRVPYGVLNGNPIVWNDYMPENITSICAWIGVLLLVIIVSYKYGFNKTIIYLSRISIVVALIAAFTLVVEYGFLGGAQKKVDKMSTTKNEWTYSRCKNINILLMDYFDSRLLTELLQEDDEVAELMEEYDGFTFFRDTLGCYNLTDYSIPVILTGRLYLGQSTYGKYANEAYSNSLLLTRLSNEGWNTNLYTTICLPQGAISDDMDNVRYMRLKPIYDRKFIMDYYGIVGFRYVPTPFKRYFYDYYFEVGANVKADTNSIKTSETDVLDAYSWDNILWHNESLCKYTISDDNVFHFYHIRGVHPPRQYDSDFNFTENPSEISLCEGAKLNLKIAKDWLKRLKEEGVYDNSVVIIMADHGAWEYEDGHYLSQTPLLMVKGYNEHHEFWINQDIPVSYLDMQQAFMKLMDGIESVECFDAMLKDTGLIENTHKDTMNIVEFKEMLECGATQVVSTGRYRPYFFIYLMNEMRTNSVGGPFYEGYTEAPAYEADYMIKTGNVY